MFFRYKYFLVLIAIPLLLTCRKDAGLLPKPVEQIVPDSIVYTDISDSCITPIRYYTAVNLYCSHSPVPTDTTVFITIDIDNDAVADFKIEVSDSYSSYCSSPSNPCPYIIYSAKVYSLDTNYFASDKFTQLSNPYMYSLGESISNSNKWSSGASLGLSACYASYNFSGDKYIGLKIHKNGKTYFGWMMLSEDYDNWKFYLKSYAINYSDNKPILAGQIK